MRKTSERLAELCIALLWIAAPLTAATCDDLRSLPLKDTTILSATTVLAGEFTVPGADPETLSTFKKLPAFCRIAGVAKPSADSDIRFEIWLPLTDWNGKFQGVGNGGFAGSISYGAGAMSRSLSRGYATASTDTGHQGIMVDATWARGHPEKVTDFGYRAIHLTAEYAKTAIRAFYGKDATKSYFMSCSNGGRQALMEAQRFPADYDGIIAGAPANFFTHLLAQSLWNVQATLGDPASYIPAAKLPAIASAVLDACDALDGLKDGLLDDPLKCHFRPETLLCRGADSDTCLTKPQVTALEKIYSGPHDSQGRSLFPGDLPGGETGPGGWGLWITGPAPGKSLQVYFSTNFFSNLVFADPQWPFRNFNFDRDLKTADEKSAAALNSTDPNLEAFRKRGGKLILYHGWSDAAISPQNTIDYYNSVIAKMGPQQTSSFVRLFMAPGMQHCAGGPGPNSLFDSGAEHNPDHVDTALERWVETGVAPNRIIATKYQDDSNHTSGVVRTRPLCPYPQVARYSGTGSIDDAANFACVAPR